MDAAVDKMGFGYLAPNIHQGQNIHAKVCMQKQILNLSMIRPGLLLNEVAQIVQKIAKSD